MKYGIDTFAENGSVCNAGAGSTARILLTFSLGISNF